MAGGGNTLLATRRNVRLGIRRGRAAGARVPEGAGRGLDVAARGARLGVGGKDEAVGEDDRARGLVGAGRLAGGMSGGGMSGGGMSGGGMSGGGELSLVGARAHVAGGHRGVDGRHAGGYPDLVEGGGVPALGAVD